MLLRQTRILFLSAAIPAAVFLWDRELVMPAVFGLAYFLLLADFMIERYRIVSKGRILVPKRKGRLWNLLLRGFLVFQGVVLVLSSLSADYPFIPSWKGISILTFTGILMVIAGLLRNKRYRLLITSRDITFNERPRGDWRLNDIRSVTVQRNRVIFSRSNSSREVLFSVKELDYPGLIGWRMKEILQRKR
jgi:hypothetical protein